MILLVVTLALSAPASESTTVREIVVEGLLAVGRDVALEGIETEVGEPLDADALTRDIAALWQKQLFRDVSVAKQRVANGWRVVFTVVELPLVRRVSFGGNDGFDDEVLFEQIRGAPFREPITDAVARADAERVITFYRSKGYPRVEVAIRLEPVADEPGQADLLFDIREGPRARVATFAIDGNDEVPDEVIMDALQTCEATLVNRLLRGCWYDEAALQTDLFRIQAVYYDLGYVAVQVEVPDIVYSDDGGEVSVRVPVTEGGQYRFGRVAFSVKRLPTVFPEEKLRRLLGIEDNDVFNRAKLFGGIERLQAAYRYELQTIVAVTPVSDVDVDGRRVHLMLVVEPPGERYPSTAPGQLLPQKPKPL